MSTLNPIPISSLILRSPGQFQVIGTDYDTLGILEVFIYTKVYPRTGEEKEIYVGIFDKTFVICERSQVKSEMRELSEHEEIQYNQLFDSVIHRLGI